MRLIHECDLYSSKYGNYKCVLTLRAYKYKVKELNYAWVVDIGGVPYIGHEIMPIIIL